METTLLEAKKEVPVDTGRLRDSGRLEKSGQGPTRKWEVKFGGVSVGGEFVDYAVVVHERQKRFLTEPFDRAKPKMLKDLSPKNGQTFKGC